VMPEHDKTFSDSGSMKRVLLTGASGFIGQHAIAPLIARGYDIHAVSSSPRETASASMRCHRTNLLDAPALARLMQQIQPTHLLHFCVVCRARRVLAFF